MFKRIIILPIIILEKSAKNSINLFLILIVSLSIFNSCSDSSNPGLALPFGDDFTYPLKVGNKWSYSREWSHFNFRPDGVNVDSTFNDTIYYSTIECVIDREEKILDSVNTYIHKARDFVDSNTYESEHYYKNTREGLYIIAYSNGGGSISYPKNSANTDYEFLAGKYSYPQNLLSLLTSELLLFSGTFSDTLQYENPPVQSLKYPLAQDLEWNYRNDYFIIDRKVVGKEMIELPTGNYDCWKIQWLYDFTNTGLFVGRITFYDYVSSKGLIKRTLFMKDVPLTTPGNPNGGGLADYKEEIVLNGINF